MHTRGYAEGAIVTMGLLHDELVGIHRHDGLIRIHYWLVKNQHHDGPVKIYHHNGLFTIASSWMLREGPLN